MRRSAGVEAVGEQLYDVMRYADLQLAEELLSADPTVAIGTDDEEWETDHAAAVAGFVTQTRELGVYQAPPAVLVPDDSGNPGRW